MTETTTTTTETETTTTPTQLKKVNPNYYLVSTEGLKQFEKIRELRKFCDETPPTGEFYIFKGKHLRVQVQQKLLF